MSQPTHDYVYANVFTVVAVIQDISLNAGAGAGAGTNCKVVASRQNYKYLISCCRLLELIDQI